MPRRPFLPVAIPRQVENKKARGRQQELTMLHLVKRVAQAGAAGAALALAVAVNTEARELGIIVSS